MVDQTTDCSLKHTYICRQRSAKAQESKKIKKNDEQRKSLNPVREKLKAYIAGGEKENTYRYMSTVLVQKAIEGKTSHGLSWNA